jgi:cation transport regulator ChaB
MLAERAVAINTEQEATGQPPAWKGVYKTMRCPGPPCPRRPYCWQDPNSKKHHPLKTRELQALVLHVQRGNALETHDDVPDNIRQQLYAAERQQYARHHKAADKSDSKLPSIVIKNVLPGSHSDTTAQSAFSSLSRRLVIPGFCDTAVEEYSE